MRTLIVSNLVTLDGFASGPGGNVMALPSDGSFSRHNAEVLRAADVLLLGRSTYEGFASYWPPIADDESQPELEREISRLNGAMDKVVVSDTLDAGIGAWRDTTDVVRRVDAHARIDELKKTGDGAILTFGSMTLVGDLLAHGLVDELQVMIGAGIIGEGQPAFTAVPPGALGLVEARRLEDSQTVLLRYAVTPPTPR